MKNFGVYWMADLKNPDFNNEYTETKEEWEARQLKIDVTSNGLEALSPEESKALEEAKKQTTIDATKLAICDLINRHPTEFEKLVSIRIKDLKLL